MSRRDIQIQRENVWLLSMNWLRWDDWLWIINKNHMLHRSSRSEFNHDKEIKLIWSYNDVTKLIKRIRHQDCLQIDHRFDDKDSTRIK
jgi:hypothetical protein